MKKDIYAQLRQKTPKVTGSLIKMRQETFRDAVVVDGNLIEQGYPFVSECLFKVGHFVKG